MRTIVSEQAALSWRRWLKVGSWLPRASCEQGSARSRVLLLLLLLVGLLTLGGCGERPAPQTAPQTTAETEAPPKPQHPVFMWRTQSTVATAFVLGSIHLASPDIYPLDQRIEDAFEQSTTLVLETDLDDEVVAEQMEEFVQQALLPPGQSAYDGLQPELRERLFARMRELDLQPERLEGFKLWFITMTLSVRAMEKAGYVGEHGIDHHFYDRARSRRIPVVGLERIEDQLALLYAMSEEAREEDVERAIEEDETARMELVFEQWLRGESQALLADFELVRKEYPALYDELLLKRNRVMADGVEHLLAQPGTYFVVVGAGHLVGQGNVLELLRAKGFATTQL